MVKENPTTERNGLRSGSKLKKKEATKKPGHDKKKKMAEKVLDLMLKKRIACCGGQKPVHQK